MSEDKQKLMTLLGLEEEDLIVLQFIQDHPMAIKQKYLKHINASDSKIRKSKARLLNAKFIKKTINWDDMRREGSIHDITYEGELFLFKYTEVIV